VRRPRRGADHGPARHDGAKGGALNRNHVNHYVWKPALVRAGVPASRENGMRPPTPLRERAARCGRVDQGRQRVPGHSDAGFTLRTYTHLMPSSDERTRKRSMRHLLGTWAVHRMPWPLPIQALTCANGPRRKCSP
jgi:hypothetical protein